MSHLSSEDVRAKYIEAMGPDCGAIYTDLMNEIFWLHIVWRQYRVLFGESQARIDLLYRAAAGFFRVLDGELWEAVLLHLSRLTDPKVVAHRETLTLQQLPGLVQDPKLAARLRELIEAAVTASKFARDWRNRRIAHRDLALSQSRSSPLIAASRTSVENALASMRDIVNAMEGHYFRTEMVFDLLSHSGDAEALLYQLRFALMMQDEREARLSAGKWHPDDLRHPPEV